MMEGLAQLSLREPLWLLLALAPLIALAWHKSRQRLPGRLKAFAEPHLWRWLIAQPARTGQSIPWLLISAWFIASLAMSGPYLKQQHPATQPQRGLDIAVVVDISPSMKARDVYPNRLERAKLELHDFIDNLEGDRTALIAFSANAYKILPLTRDRDALLQFVEALDVTLTRKRGSNMTSALELARQSLAASRPGSRAIVLVSDGESDEKAGVLAAARRLKKDSIPLYILGVGTQAGAPVEDNLGKLLRYNDELVISRLQQTNLMTLAGISGGAYTGIADDNADWQRLFAAMDQLERDNVYQAPTAQQGYPLYPWLLGLSIILFIWSGSRRMDAVAVILLAPFIFGKDVQAASWKEQQAYEALLNGYYGKAAVTYERIGTFNGHMGLGAAAYRLGDWQQALDAFTRAAQLASTDDEHARAAYNRGNTLARMAEYDKASAAYEEALRWQVNYPHAALNLTLVNKLRDETGLKNIERPKVTPDARDTLSDQNAGTTDASAATGEQQQASREPRRATNPSANANGHRSMIDQTIAQWNLDETQAGEDLGSALWQLRTMDESPQTLLRARIVAEDAEHPAIAEVKPW